MTVEAYLLYLLALGAFFATPPDTSQLLIMSNALRHGIRRSTATIFGDLSANVLQMSAAAFGLTAIIALSADALAIIKWAGVAYLVWIGLRLMLSRPAESDVRDARASGFGPLFRQGFLTSAANPYAVVFFGALFPQFIDPVVPLVPQLLILGLTYLVVGGVILLLWAWAATCTLGRVDALNLTWLNRISGALMIGAATLLGLKDTASLAEGPRQ